MTPTIAITIVEANSAGARLTVSIGERIGKRTLSTRSATAYSSDDAMRAEAYG
jgi:hypothetical protein